MIELVGSAGFAVKFDAPEREIAKRAAAAVDRSVPLIMQLWGLPTPADVQVHVMTSWSKFMFGAAPLAWRIPIALTAPFWLRRVRALWAIAAGWNQAFGRHMRVGVKPPRLVQQANSEIGQRLYAPGQSPSDRLENVVCHELTHAFSAHLRLPVWLNEGMAFVTTDALAGVATIRPDTLDLLRGDEGRGALSDYRRVAPGDPEALAYQIARGYWLTRYLREQHPEVVKQLLAERRSHDALARSVAEGVGLSPERLWDEVDRVLVEHFVAT